MLLKKGGIDNMTSTIIFSVLTIVFFIFLFVFISRADNNQIFHEQFYAKKIALLIDSASPGMDIRLNVTDDLKYFLDKMEKPEDSFKIEENKIIIKLGKSDGYSFIYFSDFDIDYGVELGSETALLFINIKEKIKESDNE